MALLRWFNSRRAWTALHSELGTRSIITHPRHLSFSKQPVGSAWVDIAVRNFMFNPYKRALPNTPRGQASLDDALLCASYHSSSAWPDLLFPVLERRPLPPCRPNREPPTGLDDQQLSAVGTEARHGSRVGPECYQSWPTTLTMWEGDS